ncbi:MAG: hypothetical protein KAI47_07745, partial [Deltaproteobacteria bacterium]|nr:hypothetical protein [Deltaproteobacteria bacterium]
PDTLAPPPPDTLYAFPAPLSGITVDCDLSEWTGGWLSIAAPPDWVSTGGSAQNAQDLSARFAARWNATDLYLAFEVTDDIHQNAKGADTEHLWQDDSVQIGLDMAQNGGSSYDNTDDFEYGWAITTAGAQIRYRWYAPTGSPAMQNTFAVRRSDTTTSYEIKLPLSDIGLSSLTAGVRFSFSALVNENDGQGREGYIEWTSGIGQSKTPANFGEIILQP